MRTERPMLARSHSVAVAEREVLGVTVRGEVVKALAEAAVRATSNPENFMMVLEEGEGEGVLGEMLSLM